MKTSEEIDEIAGALAKAQGEIKNPEKNKTATIPMKAGGKYSYDYADLPSTFDVVRAALSKHLISHTFGTEIVGNQVTVSCRIMHSSGQWISSELFLPGSDDIKSMAGNITYLRRYLFSALVGIAGDDDLDSDPEPGADYKPRERTAPIKPNPVTQAILAHPEPPKPPVHPVLGDPGEYVIKVGKDYKGKKIKELPKDIALSYRDFWAEKIKCGEKLNGDAVETFTNLSRYLKIEDKI